VQQPEVGLDLALGRGHHCVGRCTLPEGEQGGAPRAGLQAADSLSRIVEEPEQRQKAD
jgi:hypothetical protein